MKITHLIAGTTDVDASTLAEIFGGALLKEKAKGGYPKIELSVPLESDDVLKTLKKNGLRVLIPSLVGRPTIARIQTFRTPT